MYIVQCTMYIAHTGYVLAAEVKGLRLIALRVLPGGEVVTG